MAPPVPIIGIDPHKHSHTAVVLDDCEEIIAQLRVDATSRQVDQLLAGRLSIPTGCGRWRTPMAWAICSPNN